MIDIKYAVTAMLVMAAVTYIPRVLPMLFFTKEIKSPYLKRLIGYLPYAILSAMTFPAIFSATGSVPASVIGMAGACIAAWFGLGLLPVTLIGTGLVYVAQFFV